MQTHTINKILNTCKITKKFYIGCFAADKIPKIEQFPASLVVNLDTYDQEGSHWVAVFCVNKKQVYYFDSYGIEPNLYIKQFLTQFLKVYQNKKIIQALNSNVCGFYCIYFIYSLSIGQSFKNFLFYLCNLKDPDNFVKFFVKKLIKF